MCVAPVAPDVAPRHAGNVRDGRRPYARRPGVPLGRVGLALQLDKCDLAKVQRPVPLAGVRDEPLGRERALARDALKLGKVDVDAVAKVVRDALVVDGVHLVRERVEQEVRHGAESVARRFFEGLRRFVAFNLYLLF